MEILNYDEQPPGGSSIAVFSVRLPQAGMTFHKIKLIRSKKGNLFLSLPSYGESDPNDPFGKKTYHPYVEMTLDRKTDFQKKVLEALEPFLRH